jgi:hypothetical protein
LIYDCNKKGGLNLKVMVTVNLINYILYHGKGGGYCGWAGACHRPPSWVARRYWLTVGGRWNTHPLTSERALANPGGKADVAPLGTDALMTLKVFWMYNTGHNKCNLNWTRIRCGLVSQMLLAYLWRTSCRLCLLH